MLNENQSNNNAAESEVANWIVMEGGALATVVLLRTPAFSSADRHPSNRVHKQIMPLAQTVHA